MSETSDIVTPALKAIARLGCIAWRVNSGGRRGRVTLAKAGTPDILGVLAPSGRLFGLEAKMPGKKPTDVQRAWHETAIASGVRIAVVHSVAEAVEVVREWQRQERSGKATGGSNSLSVSDLVTTAEPAPTPVSKAKSPAPTATKKRSAKRLKRMEVGE